MAFLFVDRNDATFMLLIFWLFITFYLSQSKLRYTYDKLFCFFLPLAFSITRTIWVAHSNVSTIGILTVDSGFFLCATDLVIYYFLWRMMLFNRRYNTSKRILLIYIFFASVSILVSFNPTFTLAGIILYIKCFIIYEWFSGYPNKTILKTYFLKGAEFALLFQGIVSFLQKTINGPVGLQFLGENDEALRYRIVNGVIDRGAAGTFEHSSRLAIFVIFILIFVLFNEENKIKKVTFLSIGAITLYLASSRTAMLILAISLCYYAWKNRSRLIKKRTIILCFVGTFALVAIIPFALNKGMLDFVMNSDLSFQLMNRLNHWFLAIEYILKKPILGYGLNTYAAKMTTINSSNFYFLNPVHNNYLLNWFEIGLFGAVSYIVLLAYNVLKIKNFKGESSMVKSGLVFLVCVIIYNFTGWAFAAPTCIYLLFASLGMINRAE